ncbi:MAG: hypothetical protein PGN25_13445 [Methylorubrum populi]
MKRITLLAAAALVATAAGAQARHAPTRRKIVETVTIDAPADKVWAIVGNSQDGSWIPAADGRRAYTANVVSNDVSAIDVATGQRPYVIALADGRGFVTDQYFNTVTVFDPVGLKKIAAIDVGDHPEGIAATRDGKTVVVANRGDNALSPIDPSSLTITGTIETGDGPRSFGDFLR